jgi:hypothetical protein
LFSTAAKSGFSDSSSALREPFTNSPVQRVGKLDHGAFITATLHPLHTLARGLQGVLDIRCHPDSDVATGGARLSGKGTDRFDDRGARATRVPNKATARSGPCATLLL